MKVLATLILIFSVQITAIAQVTGIVTAVNGEALPYASISVKGTKLGIIANSEGRYVLHLSPGNYTLIAQYIGYKPQEKSLRVTAVKQSLDFELALQELTMEEVVIKRGDDPALEIMRQAIAKREYYRQQVDSFSVDVYIKGLIRSRAVPDRVLGQKVDKKEMRKMGIDSSGKGIIFLSESVTKVAYKKPDHYKYEVVSSRQSGGGFGLSFPFFVDFYNSNPSVLSGNLNPRGFVSPLSDNAFHFYKFKFEGSFFEGDKMIDRVRVLPRRKNEPLFDGYVQIVDGEWRLHSLELLTTKEYQLDLIDSLKITQVFQPVGKDIWRVEKQVVYLAGNLFGFGFTGSFLNVYNNYNVNPGFEKKFFNRILMKYDSAFNKRDSMYWNTTRPIALEPDEKQNFEFRDSLRLAERDSMYSRRNVDSLRRSRTRMQLKNFVVGGAIKQFYSTKVFTTYSFEPLLGQTQFNTVEGLNVTANQSLDFRPRKGKNNFTIRSVTRFGFSNQHLNSFATLTIKPKGENFRNRYFLVGGGKRVSQFNHDNPINEWTNSLSTVLYKRNYMKVYENWFGNLEYNNRFESGLQWNVQAVFEKRMPVQNTTDFSFFKEDRSLLPNHPYELEDLPFSDHSALTLLTSVSFQPGQHYIQFPWRKVPVGSKWPTFTLNFSKGIAGVFNSVTNFDKWQFSVADDMNLKLAGTFKYRFAAGGFLSASRVEIPDLQHFNGNQTFYSSKYLNSFQLAPYYQYSNAENFYLVAHAEHHFNGLFTNKMPLFNRLKWNLVAGTNSFYVNSDNYYLELFAGLENIFKVFRVDLITATQARGGNDFGVRVGMGGILGGIVNVRQR